MRLSKFWELMDGEFGSAYAATLADRHTIHALEDRTVNEALDAGVPPRRVWLALCDDMNVPESRRLGVDPKAAP